MINIGKDWIDIPYNIWDDNLLDNKIYLQSKLITSVNVEIEDKINIKKWEIIFGEDKIFVDMKLRLIKLPYNIKFSEFCYILRVIVDSIALIKGYFPMHAAALEYNKLQVILCAKTNNGKSYFTQKLNQLLNDSKIIGDDHLICSENKLFGNSVLRKRYNGENEYINIGNIHSNCSKKVIIGIVISDVNSSYRITNKEKIIEQMYELEVNKYIVNSFEIVGKKWHSNELFRKELNRLYEEIIYIFCKELYIISGDFKYIENEIIKIIKNSRRKDD